MSKKVIPPSEDFVLPLAGCFLMSGFFVGSLYVWGSKQNRNHPSTIKKRFCSVFVVALLSPLILKICSTSKKLNKFTVLEIVGLRYPGLLPATILPLFLTMALFLGPLCMNDYTHTWRLFKEPKNWLGNFRNLVWLRNVIVGPLSEEFTFRACMMPLLMQCFNLYTAIFVCSFFFGLAHLHHLIEKHKSGEPVKMLFIRALVLFSYTTLFGGYSAFIFIQTGHFISLFIIHAFCNIMLFPDFAKVFTYENPKRTILICLFMMGIVLWGFLLPLLTNHELYKNNIYFLDETFDKS